MSNDRRIDERTRDRMIGTLERLLSRHVKSTVCPLDADGLALIVGASLPDYAATAWNAMRNWWLHSLKEPPPFRAAEFIGIPILLPNGPRLYMQISADDLEPGHYPLFNGMTAIAQPVEPALVLPQASVSDFIDWGVSAVQIVKRSGRTSVTLDTLVNMASTVGQLHRMCPDLVRYTYTRAQEALARQERRSPLPDDWMTVDRRAIRDMLDHLALCHLIPEGDSPVLAGHTTFSNHTGNSTWMFDRDALGWCHYETSVAIDDRKAYAVVE